MRKFLLVSGLVISLMGCSTLGNVSAVLSGNSIASQAPVVTMDVEKGLIVAHYAYDGLGATLLTMSQPGGLLHGKNATAVQFYYDKAGDGLDVADSLDAAGNAQGVSDQLTAVFGFIDQAKALIPAKK
jgi:hypothetical protein